MDKDLLRVALRNSALYLQPERPEDDTIDPENPKMLTSSTIFCLEELMKNGYCVDQKALQMLNPLSPEDKADILSTIHDVYGVDLNWTPLVRNWQEPVAGNRTSMITTMFYNIFVHMGDIDPKEDATLLPCGHYIPKGTFDLHRYTGCPFCGTPFETHNFVFQGQGSELKTLTGWSEKDAYRHFLNLLESPVPPSGTQIDNLKLMMGIFEMPEVEIPMKETAIVVASMLLSFGEMDLALKHLETPADVLRLLWFEKTGYLQIIKPKILLKKALQNNWHIVPDLDMSEVAAEDLYLHLKLKYPRSKCRQMARVLNALNMPADKACEIMNPNRGMWVRLIRALRLAEYAKREGYEYLRELLDLFYNRNYVVTQGLIDLAVECKNYPRVAELLKSHPGMFARELFSTMLRFNPYKVLDDFKSIIEKVPLRLIISLANNAEGYFGRKDDDQRTVQTITGEARVIPLNPNLTKYSQKERLDFIYAINALVLDALKLKYSKTKAQPGESMYIEPALYRVVLPVGQRVQNIEDALTVPQGTTFDVKGDKIRLFLHWGKGMHAAPIDLDLSTAVIYDHEVKFCSYFNLTTEGAQHSGDMRAIPEMVGTAEYVELDIPVLQKNGAKYVVFTANQYTVGALEPNAVVGWMTSDNVMTVDPETGVAYDPSCVQYMVKVADKQLGRGLVFGALDVERREIIWLEIPFGGQTIQDLNYATVMGMISRLSSKVSIGKALEAMAEAQGIERIESPEDIRKDTKVYTRLWAYDSAAVAKLLLE